MASDGNETKMETVKERILQAIPFLEDLLDADINDANTTVPWGEEGKPTGGILDYLMVQLLFEHLIDFDTCGIMEDVTNLLLFPGQDQIPASVALNEIDPVTQWDPYNLKQDGNRNLQMIQNVESPNTCVGKDLTDFTSGILGFIQCSGFDLISVMMSFDSLKSVSQDVMKCASSVIYTNAGRVCSRGERFDNFRDNCIRAFLENSVVGSLVRQLITRPGQTCDCVDHLYTLPNCEYPGIGGVVDGVLVKRLGCSLVNQYCPFFLEDACGGRLDALNQCLPSLPELESEGYADSKTCFDIMCSCEQIDAGPFNLPGKLMSLPLADMCVLEAEQNLSLLQIPERFAKFQDLCAETIDPSAFTPETTSLPSSTPSSSPTIAPVIDTSVTLIEKDRGVAGLTTGTFVSGMLVGCAMLAIVAILAVAIVAIVRRQRQRYYDDESSDESSSYEEGSSDSSSNSSEEESEE